MVVVKAGKSWMLTHDTTILHGTIVTKTGIVIMKDGSTHIMKNGEYLIEDKIKNFSEKELIGKK